MQSGSIIVFASCIAFCYYMCILFGYGVACCHIIVLAYCDLHALTDIIFAYTSTIYIDIYVHRCVDILNFTLAFSFQ